MRAESPNEQLDRWAQEKRQLEETRRRNLERAREAKRMKALQSVSSGSDNASPPLRVEPETETRVSEDKSAREVKITARGDETTPANQYSATSLLLGIASTLITKLTIDFLYPRLRAYVLNEPVIREPIIATQTETYVIPTLRDNDWRWKGQSVFK